MQKHKNSAFWFEQELPNALSVGVFRDPRERVLSRYFYDMTVKVKGGGGKSTSGLGGPMAAGSTVAPRTGMEGLPKWLDDNLEEQGHHYTFITKAQTVPAALEVARRLDVVGDSNHMAAFVYVHVPALACRAGI